MLRVDQVETITKLFAEGTEIPAIAAAAGCHPNTVRTVIDGKHPRQAQVPSPKSKVRRRPRPVELSRPQRCDGCGGSITRLPCVLCAAFAGDASREARRRTTNDTNCTNERFV